MESPAAISEIIDKLLSDRTIGEWEFLYIRTDKLFRAAITPERIGKAYDYKLAERNVTANAPRLKTLSKILRTGAFGKGTQSLDIRYAFIVRDNFGKDKVNIYMNFSHRSVLINNVLYDANSELITWFKDLARDVTKITC